MPVFMDQLKAVFLAAAELKTAAERKAYLGAACGDDAALRRSVEALLRAHEQADPLLDRPAADHLEPVSPRAEAEDALGFIGPPSRPDSLGRIGHYEILEVLGRGGFGIVFRAQDESLQRVVAIKVLAPHLAATSPARKRFLREARSSAKVRHENVIQVYAVEEQPLPYLVMEFVPGETLQQRLDRIGPLEAAEAVHIGRQIAQGLAAAHATGLIHRDIKPENILIEAGPQSHIKITDFGLARAADDASMTQSGMVAGTPMYMSPEQAAGDTLDHRADLFSLGSVLYTMCAGHPPFRANNTLAVLKRVAEDTPRPIPEIIPEVPLWLCDLITRLHAKKPVDRIGTAKEVADLLARGPEATQSKLRIADCGLRIEDKMPLADGSNEPQKSPAPAGPEQSAIRNPQSAMSRRRWAAAAAVLLILAGGLGVAEATGVTDFRGTIIRLFSPEGTLVVEVDDPAVSIKIDGSDLVITGAGAKEIRLKPGKYTVEGLKDGKVVTRELVTVTNNGRQVVRVSQEATPTDTKAANENQEPDRRAAEYVLSIGGTVRVNDEQADRNAAELPREPFRLTKVYFLYKQASDAGFASFKGCKNLTSLTLWQTKGVHNEGLAHFKDCKNLTELILVNLDVSEEGVAHFKDCKNLTVLNLNSTKAGDAGVAHFKDCANLTQLTLRGTPVTDAGLAYFKDCKNLTYLDLEFAAQVSDAGVAHFKDCKNLTELRVHRTKVTAACVDELRAALPKCRITWDGGVLEPMVARAALDAAVWERSVAALPVREQVAAVAARMKELNSGFDGAVEPKIVEDMVAELRFNIQSVTDLSPLRVLVGLKVLGCTGGGPLADLSPLKGLPLTWLSLDGCSQIQDLTPLKGMPLTYLNLDVTRGNGQVKDLEPLKGMPLATLNLRGALPVTDLTPLQGMPLTSLNLAITQVTDLTPLKGMKLTFLDLAATRVQDLEPLRGMPLTTLTGHDCVMIRDLSPLRGMLLTSLYLWHSPVRDLAPLEGLPLTYLVIGHSQVEDLTPLKGMKLTTLTVTGCRKVRDLEPLKGMPLKSLSVFDTAVTDLSPLQGAPLESIDLTLKNITQGLDVLRDMKSLKTIRPGLDLPACPTTEFWDRYAKGEFK